MSCTHTPWPARLSRPSTLLLDTAGALLFFPPDEPSLPSPPLLMLLLPFLREPPLPSSFSLSDLSFSFLAACEMWLLGDSCRARGESYLGFG